MVVSAFESIDCGGFFLVPSSDILMFNFVEGVMCAQNPLVYSIPRFKFLEQSDLIPKMNLKLFHQGKESTWTCSHASHEMGPVMKKFNGPHLDHACWPTRSSAFFSFCSFTDIRQESCTIICCCTALFQKQTLSIRTVLLCLSE